MNLKDPFAPMRKGTSCSVGEWRICCSVFFFLFIPFFAVHHCISIHKHHVFSSLPFSFSLLHNLLIHSALNMSFLYPLLFRLLWFSFCCLYSKDSIGGLGLSFSSAREQDDRVIYSSTGRAACQGSSHSPCHQALSTNSRSFIVSGAPCFLFHKLCEFPI